METVKTTENIFDLPQLEVHLNISSVSGLKNKLKSLEALSSGDSLRSPQFSNLFTEILKEVNEKLGVSVPDFVFRMDPSRSWEGLGSKRVVKLPIYCRSESPHQFFMIVDLKNNRVGFWDTKRMNAYLSLDK